MAITSVANKTKKNKTMAGEEIGIFVSVLVISLIVILVNPKFLTPLNLQNLSENISYVMIIGIGMTGVMISGGLDLSIGSVMAFASCISALMMSSAGIPPFFAVIIGLAASSLFGLINGLLIVQVGIPSFIVTLGSMQIARGIVQAITKGRPIYPLPESFSFLGTGLIAGIPCSVIIMIVLALIFNFLYKNTPYGRGIYAIGGNFEAARLAGLSVRKISMSVYIITSLLAGLSGIIMTSKMSSAQVSLGTGWEFKVITAVIIGGTSMMGGIGTILGTLLGAILMGVIQNGMILLRISIYWQNIVIGLIIIFAVTLDVVRRKKMGVA
ncbi:ABC transporter permease [Marispirochaeta aestuarii]|uniref:ABC transporter permease n=1 Tax=Marispirochaeta aestuarii TaxID=1963862 RepID=UPI0029C70669|nr:ABC transporter permease [Marispirochaeta aestuarii]